MQGQFFTPDIPLTNVSQAYRNDPAQFIAEQIAPVVMVPKKTFNIYKYGKENLKQVVDDSRTRFGDTKQAQFRVSSTAFGPLRGHELMDGIDFDQDTMTEAPLDLEIDIVNNLSEMMALTKELAVATTLSDTAKLTVNTTLSGTSQWSDYANSTPFEDLKTAAQQQRLNGLRPANTLFMSYYTFSILQQHPDLIERVKYSNVASIGQELMTTLFGQFGITNIVVSGAVYDTAAENLTASNSFVWGKHVWLAYVTPTPGLRTVNGAYHFTLENGRYVDSWFEQKKKTKWVRNNDYYHAEVVGPEAFYLIKNAVA
ncbi:MAG TPA: major capsid protein [Candidatus Saccharimonadales bacterium]|nr:major capsid protein [Candidatus Saccharimonadales bacterium]